MNRWSVVVVVVAVLVAACGPGGTPGAPTAGPTPVVPDDPPVAAPAVDTTPPALRLPDGVRPVRYDVDLTLDPTTEDFTGAITTELEVKVATGILWLNANEITIDDAVFTVGGEKIAAKPVPVAKHFVGLIPAKPLAAGAATLAIKYRGKMHAKDGDGIYTAKEGSDWYAFTQFEATDARSAFPCFD